MNPMAALLMCCIARSAAVSGRPRFPSFISWYPLAFGRVPYPPFARCGGRLRACGSKRAARYSFLVLVRTCGPLGAARAVPVMGLVAARFRAGPIPIPVAQSSRRALAAPSARFAPHLRGALPPSVASAHRAHASLRCLRSLWHGPSVGRGGMFLLYILGYITAPAFPRGVLYPRIYPRPCFPSRPCIS